MVRWIFSINPLWVALASGLACGLSLVAELGTEPLLLKMPTTLAVSLLWTALVVVIACDYSMRWLLWTLAPPFLVAGVMGIDDRPLSSLAFSAMWALVLLALPRLWSETSAARSRNDAAAALGTWRPRHAGDQPGSLTWFSRRRR